MEIDNRAQVTGKHPQRKLRYQGPLLLGPLSCHGGRVGEDPGNKVAGNKVATQRLQQINHLVSRLHLTWFPSNFLTNYKSSD